jgi:hypothetical protein
MRECRCQAFSALSTSTACTLQAPDKHQRCGAGCVTLDTEGADVQLLDNDGRDVTDAVPGNGTCVATIQLVTPDGAVRESFARNQWGTFFQVYQPNKWQPNDPSAPRETIMA